MKKRKPTTYAKSKSVKSPKKGGGGKRPKQSTPKKVSKKSISKQKPKTNKKTGKIKGSITSSKARGQNRVTYTFHNVKDIQQKISLFKNANHDKLKKLVSGSRAKAVIIIMTAEYNGENYEKAFTSPPEQDITFRYTYAFTIGSLEKMAEDFTEWLGMGLEESGDDSFDYGNFVPEYLSSITVKAIMFKK